MNKLLTISIAAFNVEKYIDKCLNSLCENKELLDKIEIFVIDDGGTDRTLEIASGYSQKYPNSVFLVHKANGGYGTTVNWSIAHATGKYFKTLDGDDYFSNYALGHFVRFLERVDSDIVFSDIAMVYRDSFKVKHIPNIKKIDELAEADTLEVWGLTFKTELLKKCKLILPDKLFYTDNLLGLVPFFEARSCDVFSEALYYYRQDVANQSTSFKQKKSHYADMKKIAESALKLYQGTQKGNCQNPAWILRKTALCFMTCYWTCFMDVDSGARELLEYDRWLRTEAYEVYKEVEKIGTRGYAIKMSRRNNYKAQKVIKQLYLLACKIKLLTYRKQMV